MTALAPVPSPRVADSARGLLGVVVVSYGPVDLLRRNLAAADLPDGARVVVVDNFSSAPNRRAVEDVAAEAGWTLVAMPGNPGFGAGVNAGVAAARELGCRTFLFLNPDARVSRDVVTALWEHSLREPLSLVAPHLADSDGRIVFRGSRVDLGDGRTGARIPGTRAAEWLTGACMVVSEELFERIGGFDERYFLYWEDVDLSVRAVRAGGTLVVRPDLVAVHDEGGTQRRRGPALSPLYYRYNCRNRLVFAARNLDRRSLLRWMVRTPSAAWDILLRGGRRQLLRSPSPLRAAVSGSLAGLALALPALLTGPRPRTARSAPLLVVHPGAELYGSDRVLLESVVALLARGPVTVVLPGPGPLVARLEAAGARVQLCRMPVLRKSVLRPAGLLGLLRDAVLGLPAAVRLLRAHPAGVYVSTTILPSWVLLGRLAGRRVVCHVHEAEWPGPAVLHRLLLAPLLLAGTVVTNSRFTDRVLTGLLPALGRRSVVVPNALPAVAPVPARRRLTGPVRLLYVGRLSPRKGPDVAVAALAELVDRGVDAELTVVGSVFAGYEWFEAELRDQVVAAGLGDRVRFLGFRSDTSAALAEADVVLVPSVLDESFGNTAVEGVLAARPTVVSGLAGLREAVQGYGCALVVPPGRAGEWADAVQRVVAGWSHYRATAAADAAVAAERHAPDRYRSTLRDAVRAGRSPRPSAVPTRRNP
jgi:GT2 family glycosyltransferase